MVRNSHQNQWGTGILYIDRQKIIYASSNFIIFFFIFLNREIPLEYLFCDVFHEDKRYLNSIIGRLISGKSNLCLSGPPGCGKTLIASRLEDIGFTRWLLEFPGGSAVWPVSFLCELSTNSYRFCELEYQIFKKKKILKRSCVAALDAHII